LGICHWHPPWPQKRHPHLGWPIQPKPLGLDEDLGRRRIAGAKALLQILQVLADRLGHPKLLAAITHVSRPSDGHGEHFSDVGVIQPGVTHGDERQPLAGRGAGQLFEEPHRPLGLCHIQSEIRCHPLRSLLVDQAPMADLPGESQSMP
jgi:hypothetical protein